MDVATGSIVVFRTPAAAHKLRGGPRVGKVVGPTEGEQIAVRPAMGGSGKFSPRSTLVPRGAIARAATRREQSLGFPVDPVPGAAS
ncbi:MAG TPA: hypothetical protein VI139_07450 [Gemmatimonadales bacterium]